MKILNTGRRDRSLVPFLFVRVMELLFQCFTGQFTWTDFLFALFTRLFTQVNLLFALPISICRFPLSICTFMTFYLHFSRFICTSQTNTQSFLESPKTKAAQSGPPFCFFIFFGTRDLSLRPASYRYSVTGFATISLFVLP